MKTINLNKVIAVIYLICVICKIISINCKFKYTKINVRLIISLHKECSFRWSLLVLKIYHNFGKWFERGYFETSDVIDLQSMAAWHHSILTCTIKLLQKARCGMHLEDMSGIESCLQNILYSAFNKVYFELNSTTGTIATYVVESHSIYHIHPQYVFVQMELIYQFSRQFV